MRWGSMHLGAYAFSLLGEDKGFDLFILFPVCSNHVLKFPIDSPTSSQ
jgi:hypothetical protein